jgi:hypothetical protein
VLKLDPEPPARFFFFLFFFFFTSPVKSRADVHLYQSFRSGPFHLSLSLSLSLSLCCASNEPWRFSLDRNTASVPVYRLWQKERSSVQRARWSRDHRATVTCIDLHLLTVADSGVETLVGQRLSRVLNDIFIINRDKSITGATD